MMGRRNPRAFPGSRGALGKASLAWRDAVACTTSVKWLVGHLRVFLPIAPCRFGIRGGGKVTYCHTADAAMGYARLHFKQ